MYQKNVQVVELIGWSTVSKVEKKSKQKKRDVDLVKGEQRIITDFEKRGLSAMEMTKYR